ncbi:MAG: HlyD family efflux transporter periplasmic adaptor subunit [Patescibacteria group bacterium]|nr:HlyD family efflux transporter periplasmic adaptor subunit [Patescibacteria group bacterium]
MHQFFIDFLKHKYAFMAGGAIVLIAVVSGVYYYASTRPPAATSLPSAEETSSTVVTASGDIEPTVNPDLSFAVGGRIASVSVAVGDRVYAGENLASLDIAALNASLSQAEANVAAAEAKLADLASPPRATDIAVKQAAVDTATQTRVATYASVPSAVSDAYGKAVNAVHVETDTVFTSPNSTTPNLVPSVSDANAATAAVAARVVVGAELDAWQGELAALPASPSTADLDSALARGIQHLTVIRNFEDAVLAALVGAVPTPSFDASSIAAAQASVNTARTTVNGLITSLTATQQGLVSDQLAIQSAEAALNQLTAGASPDAIQASQAAVDAAKGAVAGIEAQIANNVITAPFAGTVGSVAIKAGELATPNTTAITLIPNSPLQAVVYVTEIDVGRIAVGDTAAVTVDAYGAGRIFPAHVAAVDAAPSVINGVSAYNVELSFDAPDPAIKTGMAANVTIRPGTH